MLEQVGGKCMQKGIHQSTIYNGRKLERIQMPIKRSMGKLIIFTMEEDCQGNQGLLLLNRDVC